MQAKSTLQPIQEEPSESIQDMLDFSNDPLSEDSPEEEPSIFTIVTQYITSSSCVWRDQINLQNIWVLSHTFTLLGTALYILALFKEFSNLQSKSYILSTVSSSVTYLVVLYRYSFEEDIQLDDDGNKVVLSQKTFSLTESLKNENAQLLGYILLWNITGTSVFKLIPFFIYSFLNITSFFVLEVFPENRLSTAISPLLNYSEFPLLLFASYADLFVFGILGRETFQTKNVYPFIIYLFIWSLRFENSEASRSSISLIVRFLDNQVFSRNFTSDMFRGFWKDLRQSSQGYFPFQDNLDIFADEYQDDSSAIIQS